MTRRASRTLIGILSITTVIGVSAYAVAHHTTPSNTKKQQAVVEPVAPTMLSAVTPPATSKPVVFDIAAPKPSPAATEPEAKPASVVQSPTVPIKGLVADAQAKIKAGDLLGGRKLLNDPLVAGQLSEEEAAAAKKVISEANKEIIFSTNRFNDDPWQGTHSVAKGERLATIAFAESLNADFLLRINGISDAKRLRAGATIKTIQGPFHAVVTKHNFTMDLYLGSPGEKGAQYVTSYGVGLGKQDSTPTGAWMISDRVPNPKYYSPRGEGTIEAGDDKNPLGKYWLALTGTDGKAVGQQSYGIHGTIDPDSIGKMASMGCIRMHNEDVAIVFELLVTGKSTVVVKD